jgi:predicted transcriptional regulator
VCVGANAAAASIVGWNHLCYFDGMKATTIKVEGQLLAELERAKPSSQSLTTYVRSALRQHVRRQQMMAAADRYTAFLRQHPEERASLDEWDRADLARPPKRRRR